MEYLKHYNLLIESRKALGRSKSDGNYEKHHIIPRCFKGPDTEDNLVFLTPREHFLAHWLLWRHYRDKKTAAMFNAMTRKSANQHRITGGRGYEEAKLANKFANKGKKLSEETKQKIKVNNARTGKPNWNSGKKWQKSQIQCTKCGEWTSLDHNKRWHEEQCKFEKIKTLLELHTREEVRILLNISNPGLQYWVNKIKNK